MSNHKFPLWKTWKQDCFASEAEQAWPPVCRTACLLDFPWIPGFLALHISVCLPVCMCDREQPAPLRGENEGKNKIRGTYLSRWLIWPFFSTAEQFSPFSPSTSEKKVINWYKFTADMAGHSRWKFSELLWLLDQEKLATPRAEMHLSLGGGGRGVHAAHHYYMYVSWKMRCKVLIAARGSSGWIFGWDNVQQSFFLCVLPLSIFRATV